MYTTIKRNELVISIASKLSEKIVGTITSIIVRDERNAVTSRYLLTINTVKIPPIIPKTEIPSHILKLL